MARHITHVPSGERRHLKDLDDITIFVASYLEKMGGEARNKLASEAIAHTVAAAFGEAGLSGQYIGGRPVVGKTHAGKYGELTPLRQRGGDGNSSPYPLANGVPVVSSQNCIYCSPDRPAAAPPTAEHVIPKSFGKFKDSLVLNEGVCSDCNQFFGDHLELILGRGSLEGVLRLDYQVKPLERANELRRDRVRLLLSTQDDFNGLLLEYGCEDDEPVVFLIPQVGFPRRDGAGWVYVAESELADLSRPLPDNIETTKQNHLIFNSDEAKHRLIQALVSRNVKGEIGYDRALPVEVGQEVEVIVRSQIDSVVFRCIAKIAFNYLTKTAGLDFVAKRDFNPIRSYIRYGTEPGYQAVAVSNRPILAYDSPTHRQTRGHLVTVDFPPGGRHIVGQVSLFNFATYRVMLARDFSGLWRNVRSGHHFDIENRKVNPLEGVSKTWLLPTDELACQVPEP